MPVYPQPYACPRCGKLLYSCAETIKHGGPDGKTCQTEKSDG